MKGYDKPLQDTRKRKEPSNREICPPPLKRSRNVTRDGSDIIPVPEEFQVPHTGDHDYDSLIQKESSSRCIPMLPCKSCSSKSSLIQTLNGHIQAQQTEIERLKHELENVTKKHFTIDDICNNNKLVTVYTGLQIHYYKKQRNS